jgi:hypothetical protein
MLNIKDLSQPELPKQDNYEQALKLGLDTFKRKDPGRLADKSGCRYEDGQVIVPHLDRHIVIDAKAGTIGVQETGEEAPIWLSILTLHYINSAPGRPPTGTLKHFREFKEGSFYEPAYNRRTKEILTAVFGDDPSPVIPAGEKLKGKKVDNGDAAVELPYYPYLPITCIVWRGDEEFPAEAAVLFDETADLYFTAEDMAVAGQMAVLELLRAANV